jgi:hypothetical protein
MGPGGRHELRGIDLWGSWCFHAIRLGPDEWLWTRPEQAGLIWATRKHLISTLADLVMERRPVKPGPEDDGRLMNIIQRLESSYQPGMFERIDMAGGMWVGRTYLPPAGWLPILIPEDDSIEVKPQ